MLGIRLRGTAVLLPAECAAALRGRLISRDFAIADAFTLLLESVAHLGSRGPGRDVLAHVCAVLLVQFRPRIRNALPVRRIVRPGGRSVSVADVCGVEIVLMNK